VERQRLTIWFLSVLTAVALALCVWIGEPFLRPILVAFLMAVVFHPVHARIEARLRRPSLAAGLSLLVVMALIAAPSVLLGTSLAQELVHLRDVVRGSGTGMDDVFAWIDRGVAWAGRYIDVSGFDARAEISERLGSFSGSLVSGAGRVLGNIGSFLMNLTIALFTLFFLLRDGGRAKNLLIRAMPLETSRSEALLNGIGETVTASMFGTVAVAAAQGFLTGLMFAFLGLPAPVLWGAVATFTSLIPVVGAGAVWIPGALVLGLSGSWVKAAILAGWGAGVVGMVDNFLRPYLLAGRVQMHPLVLFFALLGGVQAFGLLGLFAGPVIVAVTRTLILMLREELERGRAPVVTPASPQPPDSAVAL
jgi:predicted PurR-regulated permease PerM